MIEPPALPEAPLAPVLLEAQGLGFAAGGQNLLRDVNLTLREGSRTVMLGPNGAGKSLLLRLLHGLLEPHSGAVLWRGGRFDARARAEQAMVFQRPVLLRRSVLANVKFAVKARGVPRAERAQRVEETLCRARMTDLAHSPARVLSGGEQQRLALALALVGRPRMLLLDEPAANLDPASTLALEEMLAEAHAEGVASVMITHEVGQARRLGDRLLFLQGGRLVESGPLAQRLDAPRSDALRAWTEGRLYLPDGQPD